VIAENGVSLRAIDYRLLHWSGTSGSLVQGGGADEQALRDGRAVGGDRAASSGLEVRRTLETVRYCETEWVVGRNGRRSPAPRRDPAKEHRKRGREQVGEVAAGA